jgi:hypothetical protein
LRRPNSSSLWSAKERYLKGVTRVFTSILRECHQTVTRVLGVTMVSQGCCTSGTRVLQECYKSVTRMAQEGLLTGLRLFC